MTEKVSRRINQIKDMFYAQNTLSINELSLKLAVSTNTIRRDLNYLEQERFLRRLHGSATITDIYSKRRSHVSRSHLFVENKRIIAEKAAGLITPGMTVLVDAGSSCFELLKKICANRKIRIITNSLLIFNIDILSDMSNIVLLGGIYSHSSNCLCGPPAEEQLRQMNADIAFLGTNAIDAEGKVYVNNFNELGIKKVMVEISKHRVVLADKSKIGKKGLTPYASGSSICQVISDDEISFIESIR